MKRTSGNWLFIVLYNEAIITFFRYTICTYKYICSNMNQLKSIWRITRLAHYAGL